MDNVIETTTAEVVVAKSVKAQVIYGEEAAKGEEKLRARVIARLMSELDMGKAGASTYFQNSKKVANGGKVVHYRPKKDKVEKQPENDLEPVLVKRPDGSHKFCKSQQEAEAYIAEFGGEIELGDEASE